MSSHKLAAVAAVALFAAVPDSADAQYYSGNYSTFYQPYTSYYSAPSTAYYAPTTTYYGGTGYGYTSYYGGSYGYGGNPFAPLVPSPYGYGRRGWFGSGYTAAYGPVGYGGCCSPCPTNCCNPCATGYGCAAGNCATGNCGIPSSNQQMKPSPDDGVPYDDESERRTYDERDEMPPEDDGGFRRTDEGTGDPNGAFKFPMGLEELDVPGETSQPDNPIDAEKPDENEDGISVPEVQLELNPPTNRPISPNSAHVRPATHLDQRITWRSRPVIVPERQPAAASRPLIVRKTVKVQLNRAPTLVSQSSTGR